MKTIKNIGSIKRSSRRWLYLFPVFGLVAIASLSSWLPSASMQAPGNSISAENAVARAATTWTVTTTADVDGTCLPSSCTLRQAINSAASGDTIVFASPLFDSPQTITLTPTGMGGLGGFQINKNLTITGPGANLLTIGRPAQTDHGISNRLHVFEIGSGSTAVTTMLSGMTISGAVAGSSGGGLNVGGIGGDITLVGCHITGNFANSQGGGIANSLTMTIINSTISNNQAGGSGGGIQTYSELTITNSTISGNKATYGGGVFHFTGVSVFTNSTITNNEATDARSGSGIDRSGGALTIRNTIIAGNRNNNTTPEVVGPSTSVNNRYLSEGYNLIGNVGAVAVFTQPGDQTGVLDPRVAVLGLDGGTTPTHGLLAGSRAIDQGKSFGLSTDQRGLIRPVDDPMIPNATGGDGSDIGAFEVQASPTPTPTPTPTPSLVTVDGRVVTPDGRGLRNATVSITDSQGVVRTSTTSSFGFFSFANVMTGAAYTFRVSSRLYRFQPRTVQVDGNLTLADFVGLE